MRSLVIVEHDNTTLSPNSLSLLAAAKQVPAEISILVAGYNCKSVVSAVGTISGAESMPIMVLDQPELQHFLAENMVAALQQIVISFDYIFAPATTFGKNILPRLAAMLDVQPISDVIKIVAADTFMRPIYAGNAIETVQSMDKQKLITIRPTAFAVAKQNLEQGVSSNNGSNIGTNITPATPATPATLATPATIAANTLELATFVNLATVKTERPELTAARVVVSGGRGLQSAENFKLIEQLADKLHAAVGASRAAVDAGFIANDHQVGQTGKVVAPELYIAIGISGAIQHLAGIKDSKVIIAINKDADAPIFQMADYGLVGDLFSIVPELLAAL